MTDYNDMEVEIIWSEAGYPSAIIVDTGTKTYGYIPEELEGSQLLKNLIETDKITIYSQNQRITSEEYYEIMDEA